MSFNRRDEASILENLQEVRKKSRKKIMTFKVIASTDRVRFKVQVKFKTGIFSFVGDRKKVEALLKRLGRRDTGQILDSSLKGKPVSIDIDAKKFSQENKDKKFKKE